MVFLVWGSMDSSNTSAGKSSTGDKCLVCPGEPRVYTRSIHVGGRPGDKHAHVRGLPHLPDTHASNVLANTGSMLPPGFSIVLLCAGMEMPSTAEGVAGRATPDAHAGES